MTGQGSDPNRAARTWAEEELREREQQYRNIFEATSDAVVICDLDTERVVEVNPAACRMYGYSPEEFVGLHPAALSRPDQHAASAEFLAAARAGGALQQRAVNVRRDGTPFHVEVRGSAIQYSGRPHLLVVMRDITDTVTAYQLLEQRVEERTRELAGVLKVSQTITSTLELQPLLGVILDQLKTVVDYTGASVSLVEGDSLQQILRRAPTPDDPERREIRFPLDPRHPAWGVIMRREPVIIADVRGDTPAARAFRAVSAMPLERSRLHYIRAWMSVPLAIGERVIGMLVLAHAEPAFYTPRHAALVTAIANQAAAAIENARLYEEARAAQAAAARQLERLTTLARITERLLTTVDLDEVLRVVVEAAARLSCTAGAMVSLIEQDGRMLRGAAFHGPMESMFAQHKAGRPLDHVYLTGSASGRALVQGKVVVVEDYLTWPASMPGRDSTVAAGVRAFIVAPLRVGGETIGLLWVGDPAPHTFAPEDVKLVEALADQAALAIEHTRLVRRSQDAAVLEERARLARDLHDSVTQSVFSLGMLTRAAQTQHARGLPALGPTLERVGALAQEALAEMRALLFELRPGALAEEGLAGALDKLIASARVRTDMAITYSAASETRLPAEVETAIVRIVQEALGNAAKHARATQVSVTLAEQDGRLTVEVADNGRGFDPDTPVATSADGRSGGMGLRSMRERAAAAGLTLQVTSAPGAGTRITIVAPPSPIAQQQA